MHYIFPVQIRACCVSQLHCYANASARTGVIPYGVREHASLSLTMLGEVCPASDDACDQNDLLPFAFVGVSRSGENWGDNVSR
jgi:hypothetical protein